MVKSISCLLLLYRNLSDEVGSGSKVIIFSKNYWRNQFIKLNKPLIVALIYDLDRIILTNKIKLGEFGY